MTSLAILTIIMVAVSTGTIVWSLDTPKTSPVKKYINKIAISTTAFVYLIVLSLCVCLIKGALVVA